MTIVDVVDQTKKFFRYILGQDCRILTIVKEDDKWKVICEVLIDPEYTTRKGIGDMVEIYEVFMNEEKEVIGYELIETKRRAEIQ